MLERNLLLARTGPLRSAADGSDGDGGRGPDRRVAFAGGQEAGGQEAGGEQLSDEMAAALDGLAADATLEDAVRAIAERHRPDLDVTDGARLCWSAMQGLVVLQGEFEDLDRRAGREVADIDTHVERFTALLLGGLLGTSASG